MKYIFLDIDGVLNCRKSGDVLGKFIHKEISEEDLNFLVRIMPHKELIKSKIINGDHVYIPTWKMLKDFIEKHEIKVIGISSWFSYSYTTEEIADFMQFPIIDKTDYTGGGGEHRSDSISRYVKKHKINENDFVILDDGYEGYKLKNIIPVHGGLGLTKEDLKKAAEILNVK